MNTNIPSQFLPFFIPLILLQGTLIIIALLKLRKITKTKHFSKPIWVLIILFVNLFGPIAFLSLEGKNA
ncbi:MULTISPECIES: PLDc N-terminal domain-containing protein [Streptococcus]|uniref:PLDc N-terminal domain-containing protein n=1 Tax=Streptococcus TaxID=1301 RepID=UPI001C64E3CA|nr:MULTISPECIES: PLDc N-terminal domain-containing protein [Streptococcus]MBW7798070.1 PLDc N-terminal domain-containing protein [Streptococcus thermophilus]MCK1235421.1 PLDc N-terminal domain-containing protein [Streptococcus uberis]